jgi:uncharacterized protein with HEPN domain
MNEIDMEIVNLIHKYCKNIYSFIGQKDIYEFLDNLMLNQACILNLEQIGENAKKLSADFKAQYNNVPWHKITGLRNIIAHNYLGVDLEEIWDIIIDHLPILYKFTEEITNQEGNDI